VRFVLSGYLFFTGDSKRYVKEGSGNGPLSPYEPRCGTWSEGGVSFTGGFEKQYKRSL
jgi:hypothetical protein